MPNHGRLLADDLSMLVYKKRSQLLSQIRDECTDRRGVCFPQDIPYE